ncbi:hypothetical protein ACSSWA_10660 [Melioribacter sp. Ez-97]|uniref:hypothetical protein n=1 Tax=Melioribacter sp. Ez-97 TaxID=3423434 RepID=UPI003ED865BF
MKQKFFFIILLIFARSSLFAQVISYETVKKEFNSFEYEKVIQLSDSLLKSNNDIPDSLIIDIYLMRAVSYYSTAREDSAAKNFEEILNINPDYSPDPLIISPKLISLFNQVKLNFTPKQTAKSDSTSIKRGEELTDIKHSQNTARLKNLILPGWGRLSKEFSAKGIVMSSASLLNLAGMIYFIYDTNQKEKRYLNETNKNLIPARYNDYNNAYKIRNALIISYAALWIYSQIDMLIFDNEEETFNKEISYDVNTNTVHLGISFGL